MSKNSKEKTKVTKKPQEKPQKSLKNQASNKLKSLFGNKKPEEIDFRTKEAKDVIKSSDLIFAEKLKPYVEGDNLPRWSLNYIMHVYKSEVLKASVILVRMVLRNGNISSFHVNTHKPIFTYMNGCYIIDPSKIRDDITSGNATLFYLQDLSMPYNPNIDSTKLRDTILSNKDEKIQDIAQNINPLTLHATVKSSLIQQVMAGGLLDKQIRAIIIIMVVNIVLTLILMIGTLINGFVL